MPRGWYKLDNVAKLFVATHTRRDPRVFRVSCTLTEPVDPALLETALARTARQFPSFQVTLHRGLFWYYLEKTDRTPHCVPAGRPCAPIYTSARKKGLLYQVSCYGSRIDLDVFHVLADGTGGLGFLQVLVWHYLCLRHPAEMAGTAPAYDASAAERAQDSFKKFYNQKETPQKQGPLACQLRGSRLPYDQTQFFEAHCSAAAVAALAKGCGVSVASYVAAQLMRAAYAEIPALERGRPVVVSMPVNLRNYYPSATSRNFFNSVPLAYTFSGDETLETVARAVQKALKAATDPAQIAARMDQFERLERMLAVKAVPRALKDPVVRLCNWAQRRRETLTLSNLGRIRPDPALAPYIHHYAAFCSTSSLFVTLCSYEDEMVLGASSVFRSTNVLKRFVRSLADAGVDVTLYATEVETE